MKHDKLDPGAPGAYLCSCSTCRRTFIGRKFDVLCAECDPTHQLPVLDALQVLQRVGSDTSEVVNAGDFLRRMGEAGLRVIADPACEVRADRQAAGAEAQQDAAATYERDPLERIIDDFIADYEMVGEAPDGRDACYRPTEGERILIKDAILGLLAESEWDAEWGRLIAERSRLSGVAAPAGEQK